MAGWQESPRWRRPSAGNHIRRVGLPRMAVAQSTQRINRAKIRPDGKGLPRTGRYAGWRAP